MTRGGKKESGRSNRGVLFIPRSGNEVVTYVKGAIILVPPLSNSGRFWIRIMK